MFWKDARSFISITIRNYMLFPLYMSIVFHFAQIRIDDESIPSFWNYIFLMFLYFIVDYFIFYWVHRISHQPFLYKRFHKQHHEVKVTFFLNTGYLNSFDFIMLLCFPLTSGLFVMGKLNHIVPFAHFMLLKAIDGYEIHSGYDLPIFPIRMLAFFNYSSFHDQRHFKNTGNYGCTFCLWDCIFNTVVPEVQ